jgi:hypothetical protein
MASQAGNQILPPRWRDPVPDFHLKAGSPAIDKGIADLAPRHDCDGKPLGLPAFRRNELDLWFDSVTAHCNLRTADWRSRLIRLLHKV